MHMSAVQKAEALVGIHRQCTEVAAMAAAVQAAEAALRAAETLCFSAAGGTWRHI